VSIERNDSGGGPAGARPKPTLYARATSLRVVLSLTLALLCGPVLVDLAMSPARRAFGYVAGDAFYYLTVARNMALHGVPSFDGVHATNGFHPLWQAVCAVVYFLAEHARLADYVVLFVVLVGVALIAGAVALLALAFEKDGSLTPGFVALPFGVYALFNTPVWSSHCLTDPKATIWSFIEGRLPLLGTLWSYANGMESALVLFGFGLLAYLYTRDTRGIAPDSPRFAALFGAAAAFMTLARLDHALLVLPVVLAFVLRRRWPSGLLALSAFAIPLAVYLLINRLWIGVAFPMSGAMKSTFPYYDAYNLRQIPEVWAHLDCWALVVTYWREAQLCFPMVFALLYLALTLKVSALPRGAALQIRDSAADVDRFLVPAAVGVLLLGGYNFLFVPLIHQGHWYFPVSTLFITLAVLAVFGRFRRAPKWLPPAVLATLFVVGIFVFVKYHRSEEFHARFARLYFEEGPRIRAHYRNRAFKILEFDDGIVAYSAGVPAMSGTLMLDPEGLKAQSTQSFFKLAFRRGFDRVASFAYAPENLSRLTKARNGATEYVRKWAGSEIDGFDFTFDYVSKNKQFAIVRMTPKTPAP
jgi:hypothetical protein